MDGTKYEVKKDCFGYNESMNRCMVLDKTYCKKEKCGFYKKKGTLCDGCPSKNTTECIKCKQARKSL